MQTILIELSGITRELLSIDGYPDLRDISEPSKTILQTAFDDGHYTIITTISDSVLIVESNPTAFYETLIGAMGECPLNDVYKDVSVIALNPSIETSALNYAASLFNGALHHDWSKPYAKDAFASAYEILKGFLSPEQVAIIDDAIIEFNLG